MKYTGTKFCELIADERRQIQAPVIERKHLEKWPIDLQWLSEFKSIRVEKGKQLGALIKCLVCNIANIEILQNRMTAKLSKNYHVKLDLIW